ARDRAQNAESLIAALDVQVVEVLDMVDAPPLRLRVPANRLNEALISQIKDVLSEHAGPSPVFLHIGQGKVLRLGDDFRVDLDRAVGELRMLLGHDAVVL
ncbi:MAG: hypothetical protein ACO3S5_13425, partial [Ilumatobacteraceae bacterium]